MSNETKRDLAADLALCNAATDGPWHTLEDEMMWQLFGGSNGIYQLIKAPKQSDEFAEYWPSATDAAFIAEARTGWPHAIERAIDAEKRLLAAEEIVESQAAMLRSYSGELDYFRKEIERLRALLPVTNEQAAETMRREREGRR